MARLALDDTAWSSPWRTRSTLEKAVLSLGLLTVAVTSPSWQVSAVVLAVGAAIALFVARVPLRSYFLALLGPVAFLVIGASVIAVHIGSATPDALWAWGPFSVTRESLVLALTVSMRSIAAFAALLLLAMTTPLSDVLTGLRRIRMPDVLVDIAGLIYRMLFSLLGSASAIMEAQRSRLGYSSGPAARRSVGSLGIAVLMQAWNRARRLEAGLAGRGYTGSLRTIPPVRTVSLVFVGASIVLISALATLSLTILLTR